ncbi:hypothetical protein CEXT_673301 [Caerostris extrusa]|uniref:Uncharacterized protein n=1 Tax=Caerostris extrusa TaxID=172846 RepID=A0AAV4Y5V9_CAEEX|nr:hypothetical protein CEXT_673301 [Caerostris extrusa]
MFHSQSQTFERQTIVISTLASLDFITDGANDKVRGPRLTEISLPPGHSLDGHPRGASKPLGSRPVREKGPPLEVGRKFHSGVLCALADEIWRIRSADGAETSETKTPHSARLEESAKTAELLIASFCQFLPIEA